VKHHLVLLVHIGLKGLRNMSATDIVKTITLIEPIESESAEGLKLTITEVNVKKMRAKHFQFMPDSLLEGKNCNPYKMFPLISALTGLSEEQVGELCVDDITALSVALGDILVKSEAPNLA